MNTNTKVTKTDMAKGVLALAVILAIGTGCTVQGLKHSAFLSIGVALVSFVVYARLLTWELSRRPGWESDPSPSYPRHLNTHPDKAVCASCGTIASNHTREFLAGGYCTGFVCSSREEA
jgi:hypothetical protein